MIIFILCPGIVILLFATWCLLLLPRRNQPGWEQLSHIRYAHRGLHDKNKGIPENSMKAFALAASHGFGSELDVHLMADGGLAVIHDSSLKRVCGRDLFIEDLTAADLKSLPLLGSTETIPLLSDVLKMPEGQMPLIIELKVERGNAATLTDAVMNLLKDWNGSYCIESFHPAVLLCLKKKYPWVIRGQLSQNFLSDSEVEGMVFPVRLILSHLLLTVFTRPDFIAYKYQDRTCLSLRMMKFLYGVHEAGWTVRDSHVLETLEQDCVVPIFEGFLPEDSPAHLHAI